MKRCGGRRRGSELRCKARIRLHPAAESKGLVGREGVIHGTTTPSVIGVEVIGDMVDDRAINVFFDDLDEDYWFADDLVEVLDEVAGTILSLHGSPVDIVKSENGDWIERPKRH